MWSVRLYLPEKKVNKIVSAGVVGQIVFCSRCTLEILCGFGTFLNLDL